MLIFRRHDQLLEGLPEYERGTGGVPDTVATRWTGEEFLLACGLFRRLSTGEPADEQFLHFVHPEPATQSTTCARGSVVHARQVRKHR
nr:hypothetical protein [Jiangella aurantiaca]